MAKKTISYRELNTEERVQLLMAAVERNDLDEATRILDACRRLTVRAADPDFVNKVQGAMHVTQAAGHSVAVAIGRMEVWFLALSIIRLLLMSMCKQIQEAATQAFLQGKLQAYTENGASPPRNLLTAKQFKEFERLYGEMDEDACDKAVRQSEVVKQVLQEYFTDRREAAEHLAGFDAFTRSELGIPGRALLRAICPGVDASLAPLESLFEAVTPSQTEEVCASYQERWDALVPR